MNQYFTFDTPLTRHTLGRAENLNALLTALEVAFGKLPPPHTLAANSMTYTEDYGAADFYLVDLPTAPTAYEGGLSLQMKAANDNTGPSTLNVNGLGVKPIVRYDGTPLVQGDIKAGMVVALVYDGAAFRMMSGGIGVLGVLPESIYTKAQIDNLLQNISSSTGSGWLAGDGVPDPSLGGVNDFYLNTANGDVYQKTAQTTWALTANIRGPAGTGTPGDPGPVGLSKNYVFRRAASQPETPSGNGIPSGYSDFPPVGSDPLWTSFAWQDADGITSVAGWSTPIRLDGAAGARWYSADGAPAQALGQVGDYYLNETNGDVYRKTGATTWTLVANIKGPAGEAADPFDYEAIEVVDALPALPDPDYPVGAIVVLRSDGRLYQNQAGVWTDLIGSADLSATVRIVGSLPSLPDADYPIGSIVALQSDGSLYQNQSDTWVELTPEVSFTGTVRLVDSLPSLPDADYPEDTIVALSTDGKLYQNQSGTWTELAPAVSLAGTVRVVGALPSLPDADYPDGSYVLLTTDDHIYVNNSGTWEEATPQGSVTPAIIPVASLPTLPDAGYPPGQVVYNETDDTLYINIDDVWEELTLSVTAAAGLETVASLPTLPDGAYPVNSVVILTTNGRLYKNVDNATWTDVVSAAQISGQLTAAQIASVNAVAIAGTIVGTQIDDNAITTPKIAAGAVTAETIAAGAVQADKIDANAVTASKIAASAITTDKLAASAITAAKIAAGAIGVDQLAADAVTANKIAAGAITTAKLAAAAVDASKIAANAITTDKLAASSVVAGKIAAGAVEADKIAVNAVTAEKLTADSVTAGKIAAGAVTTDKLNASAVTADKIASNAVTAVKLAVDSVTAGKIAAGAVTVDKLAAGAVTAEKIAANAITAAKIQAGAIGTTQLAAGAVTAAKILVGAITADKLNVTDLSAISANTGTLTADRIRTAASGLRVEITRPEQDPVYAIWIGSGAKTDGNAVFYVKQNGERMYDGPIGPTALKTSAATTSLAADASIATAAFGTQGNPKVVRIEYTATGPSYGPATDESGNTGTINFVLERSLNGGSSWTQIAAGSGVATVSCFWNGGEGGLPPYTCFRQAGGTLEFTDSNTSLSNFMYRARITSRSLGWTPNTQRLTVQSTENV